MGLLELVILGPHAPAVATSSSVIATDSRRLAETHRYPRGGRFRYRIQGVLKRHANRLYRSCRSPLAAPRLDGPRVDRLRKRAVPDPAGKSKIDPVRLLMPIGMRRLGG